MELLTKEAREEIGKLVEEGSAALRREKSQTQKENAVLKRRLQLMESQLKAVRGCGEAGALQSLAQRPSCSVGVQVGHECLGLENGGYLYL